MNVHMCHWPFLLVFYQRQQTVRYPSDTPVNASIAHIPCNTNCTVSVSTSAWDTSSSNPITCADHTNQTFKSAGVGGSSEIVFPRQPFLSCACSTCIAAPSHPAVIGDWKRSCTGIDLMLSVYVSTFPSYGCLTESTMSSYTTDILLGSLHL